MKTYVIYAVKSFDCTVEGKTYHCVRAMVGEVEKIGRVEKIGNAWKVKGIKLIKCASDFNPVDLNKPCSIFFDENGKAVSTQLVNA